MSRLHCPDVMWCNCCRGGVSVIELWVGHMCDVTLLTANMGGGGESLISVCSFFLIVEKGMAGHDFLLLSLWHCE